jgi:hypothetical protein
MDKKIVDKMTAEVNDMNRWKKANDSLWKYEAITYCLGNIDAFSFALRQVSKRAYLEFMEKYRDDIESGRNWKNEYYENHQNSL